ncbi:MAG: MFS transporter [Verrucomicrobia bacterium]|nr:MFS transporter [Verrucomicrobiota bacterium]
MTGEGSLSGSRAFLTVFLPFGFGYLLSYLFRTINGTLSDALVREFHLDAAQLGLLTSLYFLTFAALQIPVGLWVDRAGPRLVSTGLMLLTALGAAVFAVASSMPMLELGRALIGLGCSGAFMMGLKAVRIWTPKHRLTLANGLFVVFGGLGATLSTTPIDAALNAVNWRAIFWILAGVALVVAYVTFKVSPDAERSASESLPASLAELQSIYSDFRFWTLAPLSCMVIGTAFAVHGLWAGKIVADVHHRDPAQVLFIMGLSLMIGAASLGFVGDFLRRNGASLASIFSAASLIFILLQLTVVCRLHIPPFLLWGCFALFGAVTTLSYSMLGEIFAERVSGRANGALNLLHVTAAFAIQALIGTIVNLWPRDASGHYPASAYQWALSLPIVMQVVCLAWFLIGIHWECSESTEVSAAA